MKTIINNWKPWINDIWYRQLRPIAAFVLLVITELAYKCGFCNLANTLCLTSLRYRLTSWGMSILKRSVLTNPLWLTEKMSHRVTIEEASERSIILLWPKFEGQKVYKGVIVVTFTGVGAYILTKLHRELFECYFNIVLEPSWSGYADPDILGYFYLKNQTIVQCSEIEDRATINSLPERFVSVTFGAGDWVNYNEFKSLNIEKRYDSIYIANANPIKRVRRYIQAVKNIVAGGCSTYKACLICASWGGERASIEKLVADNQLQANLELKFSLNKTEIISHLNMSKVNILLSYKEGSNRSLFESMFCNTPVICIYENIGVNKGYINEFTGLLVGDAELEGALIWMSQHCQDFNPREWALANIAPEVTTAKLADVLRLRLNQAHIDKNSLLVKTNNPEVQYLDFPGMHFSDLNYKLFKLFELNNGFGVPEQSDLEADIERVATEFNLRLKSQH